MPSQRLLQLNHGRMLIERFVELFEVTYAEQIARGRELESLSPQLALAGYTPENQFYVKKKIAVDYLNELKEQRPDLRVIYIGRKNCVENGEYKNLSRLSAAVIVSVDPSSPFKLLIPLSNLGFWSGSIINQADAERKGVALIEHDLSTAYDSITHSLSVPITSHDFVPALTNSNSIIHASDKLKLFVPLLDRCSALDLKISHVRGSELFMKFRVNFIPELSTRFASGVLSDELFHGSTARVAAADLTVAGQLPEVDATTAGVAPEVGEPVTIAGQAPAEVASLATVIAHAPEQTLSMPAPAQAQADRFITEVTEVGQTQYTGLERTTRTVRFSLPEANATEPSSSSSSDSEENSPQHSHR